MHRLALAPITHPHCRALVCRGVALIIIATIALSTLLPGRARAADATPLRIAVAANFRVAAERMGELFGETSGVPVLISSASTGVLAVQMRRGAPFDLLLAADRARPLALIDDGTSPGPATCYARGSLVLLGAASLESALADVDQSIAIANPRSAPYGTAAQEVLARDGFAGVTQRRVVMGNNVQQALQFFRSGGAQLALVARSLSPAAGLPVPADWHAPIEQFAVIASASTQPQVAQAFIDFLLSPAATAVLSDMGYQACS